jgi:hypothetical protein
LGVFGIIPQVGVFGFLLQFLAFTKFAGVVKDAPEGFGFFGCIFPVGRSGLAFVLSPIE